jgi:hypothetical protein
MVDDVVGGVSRLKGYEDAVVGVSGERSLCWTTSGSSAMLAGVGRGKVGRVRPRPWVRVAAATR